MNIQMGYSNMRLEPSEYMLKTKTILIHVGSHFGNCVQEFWERNWMNPDESTMLNMYNPISVETIQKLREQSEEEDQMKSVGEITGASTRNLTRLGIAPERAKRILGRTCRKIPTEDPVLITRPDCCKGSWHDQLLPTMLKKSQRRSMKQE